MLENMKVSDLLQLVNLLDQNKQSKSFIEVGKSYLIRTVTLYHIGRIKDISDTELLLEKCSWVADTGRFHDCLKNGEFNEVEPFVSDVIVSRGSIIDITEWTHSLPVNQK